MMNSNQQFGSSDRIEILRKRFIAHLAQKREAEVRYMVRELLRVMSGDALLDAIKSEMAN